MTFAIPSLVSAIEFESRQRFIIDQVGTLNLSDSFLEVSCTFYRILFSCTPLEAYISGLKVKASDNSCIVV